MYHVYIVRCADMTLYTGIATDIRRRIYEHNHSRLGARYTSARRPVRLEYADSFQDRSAALKEEARIKKLPRAKKLELIINSHQ
jgi:putative endonuclease